MSKEQNLEDKDKALHIGDVSSSVCLHNWKHGYTLEPVVFCTKCNKDADQVYKGMTYNEQCRLVVD
jgi:hypothetical protein